MEPAAVVGREHRGEEEEHHEGAHERLPRAQRTTVECPHLDADDRMADRAADRADEKKVLKGMLKAELEARR